MAASATTATVFGQPAFTNSNVMARLPRFRTPAITESHDGSVTAIDRILMIAAMSTQGVHEDGRGLSAALIQNSP